MRSERAKFIAGILLIPIFVLSSIELGFRYSSPFNDFIYSHSSPRESDHFRVNYKIQKAHQDPIPLKVGFIGSSVTRDGVDVRLFQERFPGVSFYNFGGTLKIPQFEVTFLDDYKAIGFKVLVYPISPSDIFKFHDVETLSTYPRLNRLSTIFGRFEPTQMFEKKSDYLLNVLSSVSYTVRYRNVVTDAFYNAAADFFGFQPYPEFDFFWQQQRLDEEAVISNKFKYTRRKRRYFENKLQFQGEDLRTLTKGLKESGITLLIYEMDSACERYLPQQNTRTLEAITEFSRQLKDLPREYSNVKYVKAAPFACEDYAEIFHLNQRGREENFKRLARLLEPYLEDLEQK